MALRLQVRDRWCSTDTLLIDEISMIDAELFDKARVAHSVILAACRGFRHGAHGRVHVLHGCHLHRVPNSTFVCLQSSVPLP